MANVTASAEVVLWVQASPAIIFMQEPQSQTSHSSSFYLGFTTEGTSVPGLRAYFNLCHHFPAGGTTRGPELTNDSDHLGVLSRVAANEV